jgi:hypothetical protein
VADSCYVKTRDRHQAAGGYYTIAFLKFGLKGAMTEPFTLHIAGVGSMTAGGALFRQSTPRYSELPVSGRAINVAMNEAERSITPSHFSSLQLAISKAHSTIE